VQDLVHSAAYQTGDVSDRRRVHRALADATDAVADPDRAHLAFASSRGGEATPLMLATAQRLRPLNLRLARRTYLDAFSAAQFAARLNEGADTVEVARTICPRSQSGCFSIRRLPIGPP